MLGLWQIMPVPAGKADGWYEIGLQQIGRAVRHDLTHRTGEFGRTALVMMGQPNAVNTQHAHKCCNQQPLAPVRSPKSRIEIVGCLLGSGHASEQIYAFVMNDPTARLHKLCWQPNMAVNTRQARGQ